MNKIYFDFIKRDSLVKQKTLKWISKNVEIALPRTMPRFLLFSKFAEFLNWEKKSVLEQNL